MVHWQKFQFESVIYLYIYMYDVMWHYAEIPGVLVGVLRDKLSDKVAHVRP